MDHLDGYLFRKDKHGTDADRKDYMPVRAGRTMASFVWVQNIRFVVGTGILLVIEECLYGKKE
jgi:hypothetical protein